MKRFLLLSIHTGFLFGQEVVDLKSDNIMVWILFIILSLVLIYTFKIFVINRIANKKNKDRMDNTIIKAMANKIAFDAERHRENQENYNYIKSDDGIE
tara:strand:+ start:824 stop:1117 length:294 start_codon:yes stop_codon:yes gene_type:complete